MKKLSLYLLTMLFVATMATLQSCDDDGYSLNDAMQRMATVRVISGTSYYLETDSNEKLGVAASEVMWYKPVDGQRVLANITLLSDEQNGYDHLIKVNFLSNVLTKQVEELTAENEETYGNDKVQIEEIWVSGNYLNVQFRYYIPVHHAHRVSLVENTTAENPDDGYIHLEYRYNNQDDESDYLRRSLVSFNLGDYAPSVAADEYKGIKIKINSIVNGERVLVHEFSRPGEEKTIEDATDIDLTDGNVQ